VKAGGGHIASLGRGARAGAGARLTCLSLHQDDSLNPNPYTSD